MPGSHRVSGAHPVAVVTGGAVGAVLRYALARTWPAPQHQLVTTVTSAAVAFLIAGFLISLGAMSVVRSVLFGLCCSAASLSAYAVLTINQSPRLSAAFLTLTPTAAIAGLVCGLSLARLTIR